MYKLPRTNEEITNDNEFIKIGTAYTFITNKNQQWVFSNLSINSTDSFPGRTLEPLYKQGQQYKIGYVLYNDQADKVTVIKGHTKGIILFNANSAVWIVHSIPHYPPKANTATYGINPSQCVFGQSMLCISFSFEQLELIGQQLLFNYPQIYDYNIPDSLRESKVLANLQRVINGEHVRSDPWWNVNELVSIGGESFLSFAKAAEFEEDLYAGLVSNRLKSNVLTETWNNGAGTLKSNCSSNLKFYTMNIEQVKFDFIRDKSNDESFRFSVHHDHSKWAVTNTRDMLFNMVDNYNDDVKIACIGDINRQVDQFKRGGGTVCFKKNENVWYEYRRLVGNIESCSQVRINKIKSRLLSLKIKTQLEEIIIL